ncbi:MAG: hypothetical protein HN368_05765 [Spirochaetales bacterium]|nr:hypothetical protein [Spirochaetales bacterium]
MKRIALVAACLLILISLTGCLKIEKSEETSEGQIQPQVQIEKVPAAEAEEEIRIPSVCIREGSSLYKEPGEGFISPLSQGEKLIYLGKKELSKVAGRESWNYALVERSDGSTGWTLTDYLAEDAVPGVIVQDAALYSQPSAANLLPNEKVFVRQIVGVIQDKKYESYFAVRWNIPDTFTVREQYVRTAYVSLKEEDVAVARLLHIAVNDTNKESQIEQLRIIQSEFPNTSFIMDVENALKYVIAGGAEDE